MGGNAVTSKVNLLKTATIVVSTKGNARNKKVWERHVKNVKTWVMLSPFYKERVVVEIFVQTLGAEPEMDGPQWKSERPVGTVRAILSWREALENRFLNPSKFSEFVFPSKNLPFLQEFVWRSPLIHFIL